MTNVTVGVFKLENEGHACQFAVGAWLSNFCHGISKPLRHLQFKNGVYENGKKILELVMKMRKNGGQVQI